MAEALQFEIQTTSTVCHARRGRVKTCHGEFDTPAFMPVGTKGSIKGILPALVAGTGAQIVLNNTYHLLLRPGPELVSRRGGVHRFMNWNGPILTDSGGYQAFSLAETNKVDDDGVTFKSIVDGASIRMTPERAIEVQNLLGADIIMAFDDCPPAAPDAGQVIEPGTQPARREAAVRRDSGKKGYDHNKRLDIALDRTAKWLERCKQAHARPQDQSLFGITQGGSDLARRAKSIEQVCGIELPGYAIGGVAVGETTEEIASVVRFAAPRLPEKKPRYLMGVGYERDILAAVMAGVDMFDCVLPTRNGRNASAFTATGTLKLRNLAHAEDERPIEPGCDCYACQPRLHGWNGSDLGYFSRSYIRHLFMAEEMLGPILVTLHNLRHFQRFMTDVRQTIGTDDWSALVGRWPVAAPTGGLSISPDLAR